MSRKFWVWFWVASFIAIGIYIGAADVLALFDCDGSSCTLSRFLLPIHKVFVFIIGVIVGVFAGHFWWPQEVRQ